MQKNNILIQGDRNKDSVYEFTIRNCLKKLSCNFIVTSCRRVLALMSFGFDVHEYDPNHAQTGCINRILLLCQEAKICYSLKQSPG